MQAFLETVVFPLGIKIVTLFVIYVVAKFIIGRTVWLINKPFMSKGMSALQNKLALIGVEVTRNSLAKTVTVVVTVFVYLTALRMAVQVLAIDLTVLDSVMLLLPQMIAVMIAVPASIALIPYAKNLIGNVLGDPAKFGKTKTKSKSKR